jgi:cell division inhibitor SulA/protein ImuA
MRAATALAPFLKNTGAAPVAQVWHAHELRADATMPCVASGFAALDRELPGGGWPQGQLIELLCDAPGCGELSLLAPALAQVVRERRACVWVLPCEAGSNACASMPQPLPYAPALQAAGIELVRSIFVKPATSRESLWAFEQSLRTAHLGAVVGWLPAAGSADADFRAARRLHLLASRHRALVFALRATRYAQAPSPAALRLQLASHDGVMQVTLLKRRGRPLLEPLALQVHPRHWNEARVEEVVAPSEGTVMRSAGTLAAPATLPARRWSMRAIFSH